MLKIAIDAMGGDYGTSVTVPAALHVLAKHPNLQLLLVGDSEEIKAKLASCQSKHTENSLQVIHTSEVVGMDESPAKALRYKKDSSLRVAIDLVKEGRAHACVSAGNTGALMATAHYVLKTLPGIDRPAIISTLPTLQPNKNVSVLDLGANADATPEHLYQFAIMGTILAQAHYNIVRPKVALLNIGVEEIKGNELVKAADQLFLSSNLFDYLGYLEADNIFSGRADVVVCDGFVGNIALKAMEGTIKLIKHYAKKAFTRNLLNKCSAFIALPALKCLAKEIDPGRHNGASLIGLKGIVIKSHGGAEKMAFANAILEAILEVEKDVPKKIGEKVGEALKKL